MKFFASLRHHYPLIPVLLWTVPLVLMAVMAVMIAIFGFLLPKSCFYWDDWTQLLVTRLDTLST